MPKKNRLTGTQIRGIRSSRRIHGALFSVSVSPSPKGLVQCACVVSKKVSPLAVKRNTIQRRCRAALRPYLATLPSGVYMFHAKKESVKALYADIVKDVADIAGRV